MGAMCCVSQTYLRLENVVDEADMTFELGIWVPSPILSTGSHGDLNKGSQ